MNLEKFAHIISHLIDFPILSPILLFLALTHTGLNQSQMIILGPSLVTLNLITPAVLFFFFLKKGQISDFDITIRKERRKIFGVTTLTLLFSIILIYYIGTFHLFVLNLAAFIVSLTLFLITLEWKISVHMILSCSAIFVANYLLDWKLVWAFALIPFVAFARYYLKKHTIPQIIAGAIVGFGEPYLVLKFFNLI